jgi:hypothetical protein
MNTTTNMNTVSIPRALLAWAERDTSVGEYARELVGIGTRTGDDVEVPDASAWSRMWCCVEAVVYAAVGADRADLLTDLPTWVAKLLGLKFSWHTADGTCHELGGDGRGRSVSWGAADAILGWSAGDPAAIGAVRSVVDVLGAKPMRMVEDKPCCKCGKTTAISVDTTDDVRYCGPCWSYLTSSATVAVPIKPAKSTRKSR